MKEIQRKYDPLSVEENIYEKWQNKGFFHADAKSDKQPYCIVIPPPNVTGVLHMGHALNNTIQDILIRWKRMQGFEALWVPGTDHAGIATQNVVEKDLLSRGQKRQDLGRERFLERVWEWKKEHGSTIIRQLKRLGCSCDWDRERFTMDGGLSNAVKEVFVRLYDDGLIYKDNYIINWCTRCGTALSDEEAEHQEEKGSLYYIKYPIKERSEMKVPGKDFIVVATTRPETMLGDTAICVNPDDERYSHLKNKKILLPFLQRELPVIFNRDVDAGFGTGALKVTPAHDPVDFELGRKHALETMNIMNPDGTINDLGQQYAGLDRYDCRKVIIKDLKEKDLLVKVEEHDHSVGHCYRCDTVVEPRLSKQWFVRMKPLAEEAVKASREGKIRFHPERWEKVYFNWMENIRDWCISRQIWWGHRIPVWYCVKCAGGTDLRDIEVTRKETKGVFVGRERPDECDICGSEELEQDPDVLDTWFSSWLWPISTLGWPENAEDLEKFYPTNTLVTAQEIIFFWVARMIMSGLKFKKEVPFRDVYIHGTVRDDSGTKMSKSLGNVIDPLDIIEKYGSDALRFSIISITAQGQDVFLAEDKFEIGRNFANKLWNASRFVLMNIKEQNISDDIKRDQLEVPDKWILDSLNNAIKRFNANLKKFRFNDAASVLYDFIWHKFCDWYLEIAKTQITQDKTQKILVFVLDNAIRLLHPIMPFVTEKVWQELNSEDDNSIMISEWPVVRTDSNYPEAAEKMDKIIKLIKAVRNIRAFWNIPHSASLDIVLDPENEADIGLYESNAALIERLCGGNVMRIESNAERPRDSVATLGTRVKIYIPLSGAVDVNKEKQRIGSKIVDIKKYLNSIEKKLSNESFLKKAPEEIVEKEKEKKNKFSKKLKNLQENVDALS